jgi:hypothetical protein
MSFSAANACVQQTPTSNPAIQRVINRPLVPMSSSIGDSTQNQSATHGPQNNCCFNEFFSGILEKEEKPVCSGPSAILLPD